MKYKKPGLIALLIAASIMGGGMAASPAAAGPRDKTLLQWQYKDEAFNEAVALQYLFTGYARGWRCVRLNRSAARCVAWTDHQVYPGRSDGGICRVCHGTPDGQPQQPYRERVSRSLLVRYVGQHYRVYKGFLSFRLLP